MMKEKRRFRVPHQLCYFMSNLAIGDGNLVHCDRHLVFSCLTIPQGLGTNVRPTMDRSSDVANVIAAASRPLQLGTAGSLNNAFVRRKRLRRSGLAEALVFVSTTCRSVVLSNQNFQSTKVGSNIYWF